MWIEKYSNIFRWILIIIMALMMSSCAKTSSLADREIALPHTFEKVGYRSTYHQNQLIAFEQLATLTVNQANIEFKDEDINLEILFSGISSIEYKKVFFSDPNNWVIVSYVSNSEQKIALFSDFRYFGWAGGSSKIYEIIALALNNFRRSKEKQKNE